MRNNFQSKSVPRGTRTIWRYLGALFILFTFAIGNVWGAINYYTPTNATEIIYMLNADGDALISHAALTNSAKEVQEASKKCGNPTTAYTTPAATSGNVHATKIKVNNSAKMVQLDVAGCSEIVACHESHSSRHVKATVTEDGKSATTQAGSNSTYFTTITLDGTKSYRVQLEGDNNDLGLYAVVLKKYVDPGCKTPTVTFNPAKTLADLNEEVALTFSSQNTNSVSYSIKKGGSTTTDASITNGKFAASVAGTYVVTATQTADATYCAVEESVTIKVATPLTGWIVFDGLVDEEARTSPVTYNTVSMTYETSTVTMVDAGTKTLDGTTRPYSKLMQIAKSTGGYLKFTIPSGYTATFTHAFSGTGSRTIILASAKINSTSATGYIATLCSATSGTIKWGEYTTPLAAGDYYICDCNNGNWQIAELVFTLAESSTPPTPVDPEFTYTPAIYTIGDDPLDLSTKLTSTNTTGAITFAVSTSDAGTTGASIANDKNFTATAAGTATITVSQEAATGYNAKTQDIEVTVVAPAPAVDCSSIMGTIYKFETKSSDLGTGAVCALKNTDYAMTTSNSLKALQGGTLTARASSDNSGNLAYNNNSFKFTGGSAGWLILNLECEIKEGDIIRYIKTNSGNISVRHTSNTTTTNAFNLTGNSANVQTIAIPSAFVGKSTIYLTRGSNTAEISYFEIVRPYIVTLAAGEGATVTPTSISASANEVVALPHPVKDGSLFTGWYEGETKVSDAYTVTKNVTLTAHYSDCPEIGSVYKFVVKDDLEAGNWASSYPATVEMNTANYLSNLVGGTLVGQYTGNNHAKFTTSALSLENNSPYLKVDLDCALEAGDYFKTTITNNTLAVTKGNSRSTDNTIAVGTLVETNVPDALVGEKTLYLWRGGGNAAVSYFEIVRPEKVTVTFNSDGGSAVNAATIVKGAKVTAPTAPTKDNYSFVHWYKVTGETGEEDVVYDFADAVNADMTLKAKWAAYPTLTLNRGTAPSGDDVTTQYAPGATVEVPDCPFSYTGYNFNGWDYSKAVTMVDETHFTMLNEDLTLTAQWVNANFVARIGSTYYGTFAEALAHAAEGEIVLLQDINVEAQVEIADGVSATIDLAGHKIEYTSATTLPSGVILVHNGGSLTINDSSDPDAGSVVAGEKAYAALMLTKAGDDASKVANLTINGGSFTGYYYAISGNGNRPNTNITINGGTFTATAANDNLAIYHPQNGTLTINGGSFEGYLSAIEMRAGSLVINDGSFTATAPTFSCNAAGSGTTTQGAAIAIAQHTTKKDIEVTINGGTFTGVKALNESNPQANDPAPQVTMAVTAGTFTGEVSTVDVDKFVSGGSFSKPVAEANCATDYYPATKPNGKYGVTEAAVSVDFAEEAAKTEGQKAWATFLADNHYDYNLGSGGEISWDKANTYDTGLKLKKSTANALYFTTEPDKVITLTVGNIAGMTIQINGGDVQTITGGSNNDNLGVSYYYSDNAQSVVLKETSGNSGYNMLKSINIRDPYTVSFDANGGDAVASLKATPAINLPSATNGTQNFAGWYTSGDEYVGMNGDSYTPTANITLVAHWEALSTVNTLSDLKVDGVTVDGFDPEVHTYNIVVPYGTAIADLPKITSATATNANATVNFWPVNGPEWTDDFGGCYRQSANVTPQDPNAAVGYNDIRITIGPKDMLCIIKAEHDGTSTGATVTGYYGGTKDKVTYNDGKLGQEDRYFGIKLAEEAGTFKAGDVLKIYATNPSTAVRIYSDKGTTRINATDGTFDSEQMFTYTLTENEEWIYLYRRYKEAETDMNPTLGYMAVYRSVPNPLVNTITFNGAAGVVDNTASPKTITVEVPATTDLATMPVLANFYSNDPSLTSGAVTGSWAEGDNEYIVTDKDGDQTVYAVTITKAVPSNDATLETLTYGIPATAITLADGVFEYNVELPYGTSAVPALAATAHHAGASIKEIADADAFANRHATSTVTVKAEDNSEQVYTVNFTVSRFESKFIWDGSTMTSMDDITAAATAADVSITTTGVGVTSFSAKTCEENGKSYTRALNIGGNTKSTRYFAIEIPAGKVAKVSLVYKANGNDARSIIIGTALASVVDESAITVVEKENDQLLHVMTAEMFGGGTLYINTTNGFQVHEISLQLADGHARSAMLGNGVLGTVCVPNNVAVEDIQGVTVYELMGRDYTNYGKLAFDEIVSGELEAGVPYLFQANGNHMALLYGETQKTAPVYKDNGMYGTFEQVVLSGADLEGVYYFAQRALWSCDGAETLTIPANRAYVKLSEIPEVQDPNPAPGRRRVTMAVNGEKIATGFENINAGDKPMKLMINGQIFILRGEKMFDATGRLVK